MGFFSKVTTEKVKQLTTVQPVFSELDLIKRIHNEFDTAQDKLLREAKEVLCKYESDLLARSTDVSTRLKSLGFVRTPTVVKTDAINSELDKNKREAELITYYRDAYPFLKFLTETELERICGKYDLIFCPVQQYIKEVPEKNLREIENCQPIKDEDAVNHKELKRAKEKAQREYPNHIDRYMITHILAIDISRASMFGRSEPDKTGLWIAAPKSHFNLKDMEQKSKFGWGKVEVKDPVVFRYVRGGIQVLTKWGIEGEDPSLVVEKLN